MAARGERGTLIVNLDALLRMSSNPFYPYLLGRIDERLHQPGPPPAGIQAKWQSHHCSKSPPRSMARLQRRSESITAPRSDDCKLMLFSNPRLLVVALMIVTF